MRKTIIAAALGAAMLATPLLATPAGASPAQNPKASCASNANSLGGLGQYRGVQLDDETFGQYVKVGAQTKKGDGCPYA